jgi:hypothetical protein
MDARLTARLELTFYSYPIVTHAVPEPLPDVSKTPLMLDVEAMFYGRDVRLILVDLYNQLGNQRAVARRLGLSQPTITHWFATLGIRIVHRQQAVIEATPAPAPRSTRMPSRPRGRASG